MLSTVQYPVSRGNGITRFFYFYFFKLVPIKRSCLWETETIHLWQTCWFPRDPARPQSSKEEFESFSGWVRPEILFSCFPGERAASTQESEGGTSCLTQSCSPVHLTPKSELLTWINSLQVLSCTWSVDSKWTWAGGETAGHLALLRWQLLVTYMLNASCELGPYCLSAVLLPEEKGHVWKGLLTLRVQGGICSFKSGANAAHFLQ